MDEQKESVWKALLHFHTEIYSYINSILNDKETARDICQDVYLQAFKNIESLEIEKNIRAWLYRVARNSSINFLKSKKIRNHSELADSIPEQSRNELEETSPFIENSFSKLPERQQIALRLREVDGYSYEDLAEHMGLSVSAVTSLLSRARENFQKNYLLSLLPDHYSYMISQMNNINDILRYINPENPPQDLFEELDTITSMYFKKVSHIWDEIRNTFFSAQDLKGIFERIDFDYDEIALDLGTGTGFIALHFASYVKEVIGMDINDKMLESAVLNKNRLGIRNVSFIQGSIENMPFYGKKFDLVFCNLVLHHLVEPFNAIKKITRVLSRGSKFVIVDFNRHTNKQLADSMKDIWLGFEKKELKKNLIQNTFSHIEMFTIRKKTKTMPEIFCTIATY